MNSDLSLDSIAVARADRVRLARSLAVVERSMHWIHVEALRLRRWRFKVARAIPHRQPLWIVDAASSRSKRIRDLRLDSIALTYA